MHHYLKEEIEEKTTTFAGKKLFHQDNLTVSHVSGCHDENLAAYNRLSPIHFFVS